MSYPEKFDSSILNREQKTILTEFHHRRNLFNRFIAENKIEIYTCPGCGYPTLPRRGAYEICSVCNWEDDNQDDESADEIWGGPNSTLSLTENRLNIGEQLRSLALEVGGSINTNPSTVLAILSQHDETIHELIKNFPDEGDLSHPIAKQYYQKGEDLLMQLVSP